MSYAGNNEMSRLERERNKAIAENDQLRAVIDEALTFVSDRKNIVADRENYDRLLEAMDEIALLGMFAFGKIEEILRKADE